MRLEVRGRGPDVLPVAVGHVAVQRPAVLECAGEHFAGEVDRAALGDPLEDLGLEDVDPGIDGVAEHLPPAGLLQEALDAAVLTGDDDAELERVLDRAEGDGGQRRVLLVEGDDLGQVDVGQHVTRDHDEALGQLLHGVAHRPGRAERRLLGGVRHADPELAAVAEVAADRVGQERDGDDDFGDAVPPQERHDVFHHRPADEGQHRLGQVRGLRAQAGALAAGHDDGLHAGLSFTCRAALPSRKAFRAGPM